MEIFESESKRVRASGFLRDERFVVNAGSFAVGDKQVQNSLGEKPGRIAKRIALSNAQVLVPSGEHYRFSESSEFNSPSEAASIIWGSNLNGRKVFGLEIAPLSTHVLYFQIDSARAIEGYKQDLVLSVTERDKALAAERKVQDNYTCQACGLRLSIDGRFVIECHHVHPVSLGVRETTLADLVSLCPTCHRVAHMREPIYSPAEVVQLRALTHHSNGTV